MYNFDVKYTFDNYYEYYKYTLIKSRILKDSIFCLVFFAFAAYIFIDKSAETSNTLGIFSIILGVMFPLMNFATLPILKKQLKAKQKDIDNTRIFVSFNDEEVIYQNLTVKEGENVDENSEERTFNLSYKNFMSVKETTGLLLFYLDKRTVIILPKLTMVEGSLEEFKEFIKTKINRSRVKLLKGKAAQAANEALEAKKAEMAVVAPVVEETPVVEEAPVAEEVPVVEEVPAVEETPVVEEAPEVEETSEVEEAPVLEETPEVEETSEEEALKEEK